VGEKFPAPFFCAIIFILGVYIIQEIAHIHVDMKLKNAKNKLEKSGFAVRIKPWNCYKAEREFGKYVIEFQANCDGDVDYFSVRQKDDLPDMQSDYCPYFFFDTCKRAIEFASH
jgi:hypothetical protein